jgi:hypothetical protein
MKILLSFVLLSLPAAGQDKEEPKTAQDLLKEALATAKEGKKRVLLTFGSPG